MAVFGKHISVDLWFYHGSCTGYERAANVAEPTRLAIFERIVSERRMSVTDLMSYAAVSQPAVSQHLRALQDARLITGRREGRNVYYTAQPRGLAPLEKWLRQYEQLWQQRVDRLDDYLQELQKSEKQRGK
ncbi:MAG: ArsR/SmtB family transcription factor, partial [Burkholderiales bacterium]